MADKTVDELLDDLLVGVTEANTEDASLITLTGNIKAALVEALKGVALTTGQRAKFDQVFTTIAEGKAKVVEAVLANTDSAPA